mgnify:CR=1 FL=1
MMLTLSMNTADRKIPLPLSTSIPDIPDISLIRTISLLMRTVFQSVRWAYVCIKMDMKLQNTVQNTGIQKRTENRGVSVNILVLRQNTVEPYTFLPQIIQDYLTYRQETAKGGIRSMAEELLWNVQTNARNRTVNHKTASTALRRLNPAQTSIQLVLFIHTIPDTFLSYFYVSYDFSLFLWYPQWTETCKANSFSYS